VDDCVLTFGPRCHLACWDAATGENRWLVDMVRQYGAEERTWYNGQCLLVDGQRLIVAPGSPDCLMMALDYRTGEVLWKTPNPRGWKMTHSSITPLQFAGQSMYAYCGTGGTAGVSADDGSLLWDETQWKEVFATSPSPVPLPDGRLFLCSGYDKLGGMILTLQQTDGAFEVSEHAEIARKVFNSEQQTPVLYQGYLYGVKKLRGGQLLCMDLDGNEVWNSGDLKFGHGPYMIADGMVFALSEGGLLAIIEATPEGFQLLGQAQVLEDAHEAWGPMALVSGRLVLRDVHRMLCLDVR
jgi:outer membrane protein assembly factor BamB